MSPRLNSWNFSLVFDGSNNPEYVTKKVLIKSVMDLESNTVQNFTLDLARHYYPSPMRISANYSYMPQQQRSSVWQVAVESPEITSYFNKQGEQMMKGNITTERIPFEINCTYTAEKTQQDKTTVSIHDCRLYHSKLTTSPLKIDGKGWYKSILLNNLKISVTNSSGKVIEASTNLQKGQGNSRVYCGQEHDQQSPCDMTLAYDGDRFTVYVRVNASMLNHTTNASLSGLSSYDVLDWTINGNTSSCLRTESKQNCTHCQNLPSVITNYNFETAVAENHLELIRASVNSTYWSILRDSGSLYFHYISNATVDNDVVISATYGKGMKVETGLYQGINQPQSKLYMPSESSTDYLEGYYMKYINCRKNTTLINKNLYNMPEIARRSLVQMNTTVRSNSWPISCNHEWRQIFRKIFPSTPITPFCAEDMELRVLYDERKNSQVKVEIDKQEKPLMKVTYRKQSHAHNITVVCEDARNPSCLLQLKVSDKELIFNSSVNSEVFQHEGKARIATRRNSEHEQIIDFHLLANNTITPASQQMTFNVSVNYTDEEGWFLYTKLNATKDLDNVLLVQNGTVKNLKMYGKSMMILSKPRSWSVTYRNTSSALEIVANVQLDPESQLDAAYYQGINHPRAFVQMPVQVSNYFVKGMSLNYTSCGQRANITWNNILTKKNGKPLIIQTMGDIDMWPFKTAKSILTSTLSSSCQLCLGQLEFSTLYNATADLELAMKMLWGKSSLLAMNYTIGNQTQLPGFYANATAELVYNIYEPSSPRMYLFSNTSILSGQNCTFNFTVGRKGFKQANFEVKEHFSYGPQSEWRQRIVVDSRVLSVSMDLQNENNSTLLAVKYVLFV